MPVLFFKHSPLPRPRPEYSEEQMFQMIRVLEIYFNQLDGFLLSLSTPEAGTTADRPTYKLQLGQQYFDTDLNIPIWYDGTDWIDAAGNVV
jgi:hypothetical protein